MSQNYPESPPAQSQDEQPGKQTEMAPEPISMRDGYVGSGKLQGKIALITGGDSGIGRAVALHFSAEGANVAISYLEEDTDAEETKSLVESHGQLCILLKGDIGDEAFCQELVERTVEELGGLDILVNNAAEQHPQKSLEDITAEQLEATFRTNIFSFFYLTKASLPYLKEGSSVINTTSVTAYKGSPELLDYSSTKGAVVAFTRSLSQAWAEKGIRVNAVAPGPIWTPLIPATFEPEKVDEFGKDTPLGRVGQPSEVAPAYVFLASEDASYITGQVLHPNGGTVVNS